MMIYIIAYIFVHISDCFNAASSPAGTEGSAPNLVTGTYSLSNFSYGFLESA